MQCRQTYHSRPQAWQRIRYRRSAGSHADSLFPLIAAVFFTNLPSLYKKDNYVTKHEHFRACGEHVYTGLSALEWAVFIEESEGFRHDIAH